MLEGGKCAPKGFSVYLIIVNWRFGAEDERGRAESVLQREVGQWGTMAHAENHRYIVQVSYRYKQYGQFKKINAF